MNIVLNYPMIFNGKKSLIFSTYSDEKIKLVGCKLYYTNKNEYDEFKYSLILLEENLKIVLKAMKYLKERGIGS